MQWRMAVSSHLVAMLSKIQIHSAQATMENLVDIILPDGNYGSDMKE
jgi:hypothetical protein